MLWSPKDLWDTQRGVVYVDWVFIGMNNTPPIAWTKIIEPVLFIDYPKHGIAFLIGLSNTPQGCNRYVMEPKRFFMYPKRVIAHPLNNYGHKQYPSQSLD
jgi:hypothetical protein